jgi:hypothetical protein
MDEQILTAVREISQSIDDLGDVFMKIEMKRLGVRDFELFTKRSSKFEIWRDYRLERNDLNKIPIGPLKMEREELNQ